MNQNSNTSSKAKPYRLALVVPNLAESGGVSTVTDFLYTIASQSEHFSVDLISLATSSRDSASVRLANPRSWRTGVQIQEGQWKNRPFLHFGTFATEFEFTRYLPRKILTERLNQYDIVQVVAGTPAWGMICRDLAVPVCLQVATLATVERARLLEIGSGPVHWWRKLMTRITSTLDRRALKHVDRVLVENQWMNDFVSEQINRDRVIYAPPGVDTAVFHPKSEKELEPTPYILSVGRFADPRKNVPLLFEAYAQLRSRMTDAPRLMLAGKTGPTSSDWKLAERLQIREWLDFKEGLTFDQLRQVYRNAQIFVLASDEEGFGMVILESMASGVPVISTKSGGPDGIINHEVDGLLVPLKDPDALSSAMEHLIRSTDDRIRLGTSARNAAVNQFSLEVAGNRFLNCYHSLLDEGTAP